MRNGSSLVGHLKQLEVVGDARAGMVRDIFVYQLELCLFLRGVFAVVRAVAVWASTLLLALYNSVGSCGTMLSDRERVRRRIIEDDLVRSVQDCAPFCVEGSEGKQRAFRSLGLLLFRHHQEQVRRRRAEAETRSARRGARTEEVGAELPRALDALEAPTSTHNVIAHEVPGHSVIKLTRTSEPRASSSAPPETVQ